MINHLVMRFGRGVLFNMGEWGCLEDDWDLSENVAREKMQRTLGNEKQGKRQGLVDGLRERSRDEVLET